MGSERTGIDLSPGNVRYQDALLSRDVREHGEIPNNYYWKAVEGHLARDLAETGNDHRFARDHPWVLSQFRKCGWIDGRPPGCPRYSTGAGPGSGPGEVGGCVSEPPGSLLLAVGVIAAAIVARVVSSRQRRPCFF